MTSWGSCATVDELDEIAQYIKDQISEYGKRPTNRIVRRIARTLISQAGYPADEFLNAA